MEQLTDLTFVLRRYRQYSRSWDHDHCERCSATFMVDGGPEGRHLAEGFTNLRAEGVEAGHFWVCPDCAAELDLKREDDGDPEAWPYEGEAS